MLKNNVLYFHQNTAGRDFIIGDLHGCYGILLKMMQHVKFDKTVDRMFCVGDLADRGPEPLKCIELIYENWFHACFGNHEDMLVQSFTYGNGNSLDTLLSNGGRWVNHESGSLLKVFGEDMEARLPYVMIIETPLGRRNVVHAEITRNIDHKPPSDADIDNWNFDAICEIQMFWGRKINDGKPYTLDWDAPKNLSITYCGHSVVDKPEQVFNHRFIDTGAAYAKYKGVNTMFALTMVNLMTEETYQCNAFEDVVELGNIWK